jgi:hypothetical protein
MPTERVEPSMILIYHSSLWLQYRSPEEFQGHDLDEKIDIFSFGNNIYGLVGPWIVTHRLSICDKSRSILTALCT